VFIGKNFRKQREEERLGSWSYKHRPDNVLAMLSELSYIGSRWIALYSFKFLILDLGHYREDKPMGL
jgi:hypothetical protein